MEQNHYKMRRQLDTIQPRFSARNDYRSAGLSCLVSVSVTVGCLTDNDNLLLTLFSHPLHPLFSLGNESIGTVLPNKLKGSEVVLHSLPYPYIIS